MQTFFFHSFFAYIDKQQIKFDNLENELYHETSGAVTVVAQHHRNPFLQ